MKILSKYSLKASHTLASPATAKWYCEPSHRGDIEQVLSYCKTHDLKLKILGEGSNVVMPACVDAMVVRLANRGCQLIKEYDDSVLIQAQAAHQWHDFVEWCVTHHYCGVENLAFIPGTVGAAPVQNIGAYGMELLNVVHCVEAYDISENRWKILTKHDCAFSYRDSVFKRQEGRYLIFSVTFKLDKKLSPILNYGPLAKLADHTALTATDIFNEVITVRRSKLPNPDELPNAGSFFKNPIVEAAKLNELLSDFPDLVHYPASLGAKLAAGWLIEQCGLKGKADQETGVGCYSKQSLVLINPSNASGADVMRWAEHVKSQVFSRFGVLLEVEPRYWL